MMLASELPNSKHSFISRGSLAHLYANDIHNVEVIVRSVLKHQNGIS